MSRLIGGGQFCPIFWICACGQEKVLKKQDDPQLFEKLDGGEAVITDPCEQCGRSSLFLNREACLCFDREAVTRHCDCGTAITLSATRAIQWMKGESFVLPCPLCLSLSCGDAIGHVRYRGEDITFVRSLPLEDPAVAT